MKQYIIKKEYLDQWGTTADAAIVTESEILDLAHEWETTAEELLEQVDEAVAYEVSFTDANTGATSPIDNIVVRRGYTPEQYVEDCAANGVEWGEGEITFTEIEE